MAARDKQTGTPPESIMFRLNNVPIKITSETTFVEAAKKARMEIPELKKTTAKRLRIGNIEQARKQLSLFISQRYNNAIEAAKFKDMVNGISKLLEYDKHMEESELLTRQ
jgi:hypothetical protein